VKNALIRVRVKYFAYIRSLVNNKREEEIELNDQSTILELIRVLARKYGKTFIESIFKDTRNNILRDNVILLHNGQSINNLEMPLRDGDTISFLPFLGGG